MKWRNCDKKSRHAEAEEEAEAAALLDTRDPPDFEPDAVVVEVDHSSERDAQNGMHEHNPAHLAIIFLLMT